MIESTVINRLLGDAALTAYANGKIYVTSAPEGTKTPYIAVSATDSPDESDAIAVFDVDINIYDYREDQRPIRAASKRVKELLHAEILNSDDYGMIRLSLEGRSHMKENQATLVRINMQFSARAIELLP